ncbi:MAG TPA: TIGR03085 family metal-binding protein [Dermatophilaceae bacterium]|nr:TIGR03085 family metal-binding protein [Dermatophilaceae bacterium]
MTRLDQLERQGICDTLVSVGPDAPTLCSPWLARDLAAHLVVRESRPDAAAGIRLPLLAGHLRRVQDGYAALPWPELVDRFRSGPPRWSLVRVLGVGEAFDTSEFFIHHEDLLRAGSGWQRRQLSPELEAALWRTLGKLARLAVRRSPTGVTLVAEGFRPLEVLPATDRGAVVLHGTPGELTLYTSGRQRVAEVVLDGPREAAAAFAGSPIGFG